jgi:hypothetical protein
MKLDPWQSPREKYTKIIYASIVDSKRIKERTIKFFVEPAESISFRHHAWESRWRTCNIFVRGSSGIWFSARKPVTLTGSLYPQIVQSNAGIVSIL